MEESLPSRLAAADRGVPCDVDALIDRPRLTMLQIRTFLICALVLFCEGYDLQALALAVPSMAGDFGVSPDAFGLSLSASLLGMAVGGAGFAPLGDRIGRKPMLVIAMLATGFSTLAALMFVSTWWIVACRLLTGIGLGITGVNAAALSGEYAPDRWRFLTMTLLTCCVPLGAFTAAMAAPGMIAAWSWRAIFVLGGGAPLVVAVLVVLLCAESLKWLLLEKPGDPRIAAILRRMCPEADPAMLSVNRADGPERQSVFGLLAPAHRVRTAVVWLSAASGAFCLYMLVSWLPTVLANAHWSGEDALRGTAAVQLGGIAGSLLMAWAIDRRRLLMALLLGYGCAAAALLGIGLLPSSVHLWQFLLLLVGAGTSGMQAVWMAISIVFYPLGLRATSAGWVSAVSRIGAVAAPLVGGAALRAHVGAEAILLGLLFPIAISIAAIIFARRYFVRPDREQGERH